ARSAGSSAASGSGAAACSLATAGVAAGAAASLGVAVASLAGAGAALGAGAASLVATAAAPAAAAASLAVPAVGAPASCAMAEALLAAARIRAKAVLAKMRPKRGPFMRTLSQQFLRTRGYVRGPTFRSTAPSECEPDVDSLFEATAEQIIAGEFGLIAGEFGRFWFVVTRSQRASDFFLNNCHRITTQALSYPRVPHRVRARRVCGKAWSVRCATAARPPTSDRGNG